MKDFLPPRGRCEHCGGGYVKPPRSSARYCSKRCWMGAYRKKKKQRSRMQSERNAWVRAAICRRFGHGVKL